MPDHLWSGVGRAQFVVLKLAHVFFGQGYLLSSTWTSVGKL